METNKAKQAERIAALVQFLTHNAEISVECHGEDLPFRGNAMASGQDDVDREAEEWIASQLADGNEWAWCLTCVVATWEGYTGKAYLGGCSYLSEADFMRCEGDQQTAEAIGDLAHTILHARDKAERALLAAGVSL